jgi:hypothetical protein
VGVEGCGFRSKIIPMEPNLIMILLVIDTEKTQRVLWTILGRKTSKMGACYYDSLPQALMDNIIMH